MTLRGRRVVDYEENGSAQDVEIIGLEELTSTSTPTKKVRTTTTITSRKVKGSGANKWSDENHSQQSN